uniref:Uncharacterized protein n=1 Tax=Rhizophora mucronata TaxID=61149 RepID=A0A2P2IZW2_RHIMU
MVQSYPTNIRMAYLIANAYRNRK